MTVKPAPFFLLLISLSPLIWGTEINSQQGMASYYADALHGRPTASGEPYNKNALSAAHKTLPFGTRVRVSNPDNGKSVIVTVNDRGPFVKGRIIDLSRAAAQTLDMLDAGEIKVNIEVL